ncbi:hypothetical protein HPB50_027837 [Hyalomma asiaticum]|nr:hypothetical protein HPB50_027837 [Hyalomma asiaticum]
MSDSAGALLSAVSETLGTPTCLISPHFRAHFGYSQPPKAFMGALAVNWTTQPSSQGFLDSMCGVADCSQGSPFPAMTWIPPERLVFNSALSTVEILGVCGGETIVHFLTSMLEISAAAGPLTGHADLLFDEAECHRGLKERQTTRCLQAHAMCGCMSGLACPA